MANPNSVPPPHFVTGQYAPPPFYQPYNGNPQTPNGPPFPQGLHHNPAFAAQASNSRRFEANSNTSTPPPLPFLFPPNTDFEGLRKHIEAHGLPPPPPPPPGQAFPSTFAPSPHPAAAPIHQQPPPLNFQHPRPPFPQISSPAVSQSPFRAQNGYAVRPHQETPQNVAATYQPPPLPIPGLDGTNLSRVMQQESHPETLNNEHAAQWNSDATARNAVSQTTEKERDTQLSRKEKHDKARAAISDFISAGITYQNLVQEGIKPPVLDQLFTELGIERHTADIPSGQPALESAPSEPVSNDAVTQQSQHQRQTTSTPQPAVLDPAMERKDRIAQLLALKKGQAVTSAKSSQSASPAPVDVSPRQPPKPAPIALHATSVEQPAKQVTVDTAQTDPTPAQGSTAQPRSADSAVNQFNSLPTPVREEMKQQGFSIPGLFLTSAEEGDQPEPPVVIPAPAEPMSLKRSAEPFSSNVMPQAKRQVSQVVDIPQEMELTNGAAAPNPADASLSSPLNKQTVQAKEIPALSDSDKPLENGTPASRPKINQDKLKNRMAALKADLMRKNTRKQALQDGMPVLDAEVERTRERLLEQQTRLSAVRKDIEAKTTQLTQAREEEGSILNEIQRLEHQLADGESGQKEFSNELTQLNDQIVANENESKTTPQATARSSPQAEVPQPQPEILVRDAPIEIEVEVVPTTEPVGQHVDTQNTADAMLSSGETHLRLPSHDRQQTETEYSPEQEDLDRQLNFQIATSAVQDQDMVNGTNHHSSDTADAEQEPFDGPSQRTQISTTATPSEDRSADDSEDDRMSIDEASDAGSDGSASMSDGSDDYEPAAEVQDAQPIPIEDNDEYDPEDATQFQQPLEAENDDYEPAEEVDVLNADTLNGLRKEPDVPASSLPEQFTDADVDRSSHVLTTQEGGISAVSHPPVADDVELPLTSGPTTDDERLPLQQPTQPPSDLVHHTSDVLQPEHVDTFPEEEAPAVPRFKPYESPLSSLKSFRFNPQFNQLVKNGYRSLTYSNRIDAGKPLCPTELEGQMCTDVKCGEQHFGGMGLSGT